MKTFGDVIETVESLSFEEQEDLMAVLQRRLREHRRAELEKSVRAARREFRAGNCKGATPEEILKQITT